MAQTQNIQWFPGHMTKTKRKIEESLKLVDAAVELIDARIPISSRNPDIDTILSNKPRLILMNKCDMADKVMTEKWITYFKSKGIPAISVDCKSGKGLNNFLPEIKKLLEDKIKQWNNKGMVGRHLRIMVVGIPNVGKSSFINKMAGKNRAKAEDRPGVTRANQWFTLNNGLELLDTPGVLWPKFDDQKVGENLAFTGAVKDQIMDIELLAMRFLEVMSKHPKEEFIDRFKLDKAKIAELEAYEFLELIGRKRGMLISGGEIDTLRAATMVMDEYRSGKLGKITLEFPEDLTAM